VKGIDLSGGMLAKLREKYGARCAQIELVEGSYVGRSFGEGIYDYVVATLTAHHLSLGAKARFYAAVRAALRPGGRYVEGDQVSSPREEENTLRWYRDYIEPLPGGDRAEWNYDVTLSAGTTERMLCAAGFAAVELVWKNRSGRMAVFVAT
jgi:tRNA (cmo5U34)-methyltransferase